MKNRIVVASVFASLLLTTSNAVSLKDAVDLAIKNNPSIMAEKSNQEAYRKYVDERKGKYLPTLDLESYFKKGTKERPLSEDKDSGYNAALVMKQLIYDGGLTPSEVAEAEYQNSANRYRSFNTIENTILETVKSYTSLVESDEKLTLGTEFIKTNEKNLLTAKEKEEISGEVLEVYQVSSKLNFAIDKYIDEQDINDTNIAEFVKYVGVQPSSDTCRPLIDKSKLPSNLKEAIESAVSKNYKILEQIENIKLQREKIAQSNASFLPNLNLVLSASVDKGIELKDDRVTDKYARLNFNWNLFNGNRDKVTTEQEEIFLLEQKKILDNITNGVVSNVKSYYGKYTKYQKRIESLSKYVDANLNIVEVYKNEFEAGTRTFVDILNAESELYQSRKSLLSIEHLALDNYYNLMFELSQLSDTILTQSNQVCKNVEARTFSYTPKKQNKGFGDLDSLTDNDIFKKELSSENETSVNNTSTDVYKSFVDAPRSYFTINLATKNGMRAASRYITENNLGKNAYAFEFGPKMKSAKVLYGVYSSVRGAKFAMKKLANAVLLNKPYVDNISKHQVLYSKYN
jgi:adhesin transport system outer membrane protein